MFRRKTRKQVRFYDVDITWDDIVNGTVSLCGEETNPVSLALRRATGQPLRLKMRQGYWRIVWPGTTGSYPLNYMADAWLKEYDGMQYEYHKYGGPQKEPLSFRQKFVTRVPRGIAKW